MNSDIEVIWRRGDAEMPKDVKHVVKAAQDELLLRSLQLPVDAVEIIRYNASKSDMTINEYISFLILGSISDSTTRNANKKRVVESLIAPTASSRRASATRS